MVAEDHQNPLAPPPCRCTFHFPVCANRKDHMRRIDADLEVREESRKK